MLSGLNQSSGWPLTVSFFEVVSVLAGGLAAVSLTPVILPCPVVGAEQSQRQIRYEKQKRILRDVQVYIHVCMEVAWLLPR